MRTSATYRLVDDRLGSDVDLAEFVAQRRSETPQPGWERIARDLEERTGVYVSWATLQRWFPKDKAKSA